MNLDRTIKNIRFILLATVPLRSVGTQILSDLLHRGIPPSSLAAEEWDYLNFVTVATVQWTCHINLLQILWIVFSEKWYSALYLDESQPHKREYTLWIVYYSVLYVVTRQL
jgi:hypothetical protein